MHQYVLSILVRKRMIYDVCIVYSDLCIECMYCLFWFMYQNIQIHVYFWCMYCLFWFIYIEWFIHINQNRQYIHQKYTWIRIDNTHIKNIHKSEFWFMYLMYVLWVMYVLSILIVYFFFEMEYRALLLVTSAPQPCMLE